MKHIGKVKDIFPICSISFQATTIPGAPSRLALITAKLQQYPWATSVHHHSPSSACIRPFLGCLPYLQAWKIQILIFFSCILKKQKNQLLCWEHVGYSSQLFSLVLENLFCPLLKHKGQLPPGKDVHQMWLCSCSVYGKCIKRWMTWILCWETKRRWVKRALELFPRDQSPARGAEITPCNYPPKYDLHGFTQTIYLSLK